MSEPMMWLLVRGVWETLAMTFVSGFFGFVVHFVRHPTNRA